MKHSSIALIALPMLLLACSSENKVPLSGERETIFAFDQNVVADPSAKGASIVLPSPQTNSTWAMASGNAAHAMEPVSFSSNPNLIWNRSVGRGSGTAERLLNGPVASGGVVYTVDTYGIVKATRIENGDVLWENDSTPENKSTQPFSGGLAFENGKIFCATPAAEIVMMDGATGAIEKRFPLTAPVRAAPTVDQGFIYVVTINNQLEAFNYNTGEALWSHTGMIESAGLLGGASPAVSQQIVIVPYTSGEVYALNRSTGAVLWSDTLTNFRRLDPVSSLFHIKARPVIYRDVVYLISHGGQMRALRLQTGEKLWEKQIAGIRTPAVSGDFIFMVSAQEELICMNRLTGAVVWVEKLQQFKDMEKREDKIMWAGPVLAGHHLALVSSHGQLILCDPKSGKTVQTLSVDGPALLSPIVVDQTLLVLTDKADLAAYR